MDGREVFILTHFEQGYVKGSPAKVKDQDEFVFFTLVQAIGQCCGGGLVDDAQHGEAGDLSGLLGFLTLCVIEVCRNRNDGVRDGFTQVLLCIALELCKNPRGNFLGSVLLVVDFLLPVGAHVALDGRNGAVDVGHCLALRGFSHEDFAIFGVCHDRGSGPQTFCVGDYGGFSTFEYGHHRVGGSEVNSYCACHLACSLRCFDALI